MFGLIFVNLDNLPKYKWIVLGISLLLLALVFIPGFGVESYGAKRWLNLGFFTIQPSEYSKFGLVIFLSAYMCNRSMDKFKNVLPALAAGLAMCVLIILEPNMSITLCVGATLFALLFLGGVKVKHFLLMAAPALLAIPALIIAEPYRLKRLAAFLDPWSSPQGEGYQLIQSYYALGSGGWFGVGLFNSRQKYLFLPFSKSDFILSVIGEELGVIGCLFLIALFCVLIYRGFRAAANARTRFRAYLAAGVTLVIAIQTVINIAVVCGAVPPTGLPLPYISAGGSSVVAFMAASGALLNISADGYAQLTQNPSKHSM